jgi:hypothetical protein
MLNQWKVCLVMMMQTNEPFRGQMFEKLAKTIIET